jgi:hypothetical protein
VKKQTSITKREVVNGYHQKGSSKWVSPKVKKLMGIINREGSEWVSSKAKK